MASLRSVGDGVVIGRPNVFVSMPMRSIPIEFAALDASGKSEAHWHHRRHRKARTAKLAAGFSFFER
jgi:hypothetical protein